MAFGKMAKKGVRVKKKCQYSIPYDPYDLISNFTQISIDYTPYNERIRRIV